MMEASKGIGQKYRKGATKDCFLFDSWFSSKRLEESVMEVGAESIGIVKKKAKGLCKDTIKNIKNDWPGGSYLMLRIKPMVHGGRPLIAIGYKYDAWKIIYFIVTYNAGSTQVIN